MFAIRRLFRSCPLFVRWLCVAALAMKLLVPTGYMIANQSGHIAITLCPGVAPTTATSGGMHMTTPDHAMSGHAMPDHDPSTSHGKTELPCAFSGLSAQALASVDAILLIAAIAFVVATGVRPIRPPVHPSAPHLRPPLRGPPTLLSTV
ncbi:hypothetical protein ASF00_07220 [Sphingomonas sp. Leaf34]|uniref:hypothetical protein n=1 Tax=Sphingomonas sp. Leaf34 TaxID=1736216 RepID=UPI0007014083|nr:hypothetical protein [Sphingomonas sp. Leaf34]KQN30512.1 hypothetical protein ASF00_07220 [Sphingomonas sp. Leaf34]